MTVYKVIPEQLDAPVKPANEIGSDYILIMYGLGGERRTAQRERAHVPEEFVWVVRDELGSIRGTFSSVQALLDGPYKDVRAIPKDDLFSGEL